MIKIIKALFRSVIFIFLFWFIVSYIDIVIYNLDGGSDHMWNLFYIVMGR